MEISKDRSEPELENAQHTLITTRTPTATATNSQTTATALGITQDVTDETEDGEDWEVGRSQTSFTTSVAEDGQTQLRVPPPLNGDSFETARPLNARTVMSSPL